MWMCVCGGGGGVCGVVVVGDANSPGRCPASVLAGLTPATAYLGCLRYWTAALRPLYCAPTTRRWRATAARKPRPWGRDCSSWVSAALWCAGHPAIGLPAAVRRIPKQGCRSKQCPAPTPTHSHHPHIQTHSHHPPTRPPTPPTPAPRASRLGGASRDPRRAALPSQGGAQPAAARSARGAGRSAGGMHHACR